MIPAIILGALALIVGAVALGFHLELSRQGVSRTQYGWAQVALSRNLLLVTAVVVAVIALAAALVTL